MIILIILESNHIQVKYTRQINFTTIIVTASFYNFRNLFKVAVARRLSELLTGFHRDTVPA